MTFLTRKQHVSVFRITKLDKKIVNRCKFHGSKPELLHGFEYYVPKINLKVVVPHKLLKSVNSLKIRVVSGTDRDLFLFDYYHPITINLLAKLLDKVRGK